MGIISIFFRLAVIPDAIKKSCHQNAAILFHTVLNPENAGNWLSGDGKGRTAVKVPMQRLHRPYPVCTRYIDIP